MENTSSAPLGMEQKIFVILQKWPVVMQLLRFVAIGFLNTGLSFVVSNLISKYFGVTQGNSLGVISGVGFILATFQSYFWNKYWAFGEQTSGLLQNFARLIWVGLTGVLTLASVYLGSQFTAPYYYYFIILIVFGVAQLALWQAFKFSKGIGSNNALTFFIVSLIGFFINFFIASKFSELVHLTSNGDLNKNLALVVATAFSLIWNFIGYKIFVFKK